MSARKITEESFRKINSKSLPPEKSEKAPVIKIENIVRLFYSELPDPEDLTKNKSGLLDKVYSEIKNIMIDRGKSYSSLSDDIFANFRDLQDLTFLVLTRLKADRLFNSVIVSMKQGSKPTLTKNKDHILDIIIYLILYYGFLDEREVNS